MILLGTMLVGMQSAQAHDDHHTKEPLQSQSKDFATVQNRPPAHSNAPASFAPCIRGTATVGDTEFPCERIDLMSWLDLEDLGGGVTEISFVNDIWGWTDPETGTDYVLLGAAEGVVFVDISDPKRPEVLGILPTASTEGGEFWRDLKVYADHVFVVSEHENHPMQVFDLTQLRDVTEYTTFEATALYSGTAEAEMLHAHNIAINTETGFAYIVGSDSCEGGLHMVDISDPANPTFAGCFGDYGYIHDVQCVIYEGPDADYRGREICFAANAEVIGDFNPEGILNALAIIDVTDKDNPVGIAQVEYEGDGYSHQGWLTPDQQYFLHGDELDEIFYGVGTTTRVWDVRDLDNPMVIGVFENDTTSIDHNIYTEGRWAFASNYTSGLRVYDLADVAEGELMEIAYFDVYPENDNASFEGGTWSNYAYFRQKNIVAVSSMDRGLFILRPRLGGQQG
jgi:choice-of-anchor B domain-containing protein